MVSEKKENPAGQGALSVGDTFHCVACGRDSIVKSTRVMAGWQCVGERLTCAFCGVVVSGTAADGAEASAGHSQEERRLDALASLLGTESGAGAALPDLGESDGRFCKNCRHYLRHPFQSRCLLHDRNVEPMDDCDDFSPLPPPAADSGSAAADAAGEKDT